MSSCTFVLSLCCCFVQTSHVLYFGTATSAGVGGFCWCGNSALMSQVMQLAIEGEDEATSPLLAVGGPLRFIIRSNVFFFFSPSVWTYFPLRSKKKKLGNAGQTKINLTPAFQGRRRLGLDLTPIFLPSSSSIANLVALSPHWERIPTQNPFVNTRISPRCMSGQRIF